MFIEQLVYASEILRGNPAAVSLRTGGTGYSHSESQSVRMKRIMMFFVLSLLVVFPSNAEKEVSLDDYYTVSEIYQIYTDLALESGATSTQSYTVRGYVTKWESGYPDFQNGQFYIDDDADGSTSKMCCFRLKADNDDDKHALNTGDYIEATAMLKNYNGKAELVNGTYHVVAPPTVTYTLQIMADEGGTVNSSVNGTYESGEQVTVSATPDVGYVFTGWSDGNTDNPRVITMTGDISLVAFFEKAQQDDCTYSSLEGLKSKALLSSLHSLIADHTVLSYDDVRGDRANVDINADGNIWDIYSDCSFSPKGYCRGSDGFAECECYNREHALPKSWWGGSDTEPMYTDLYHIFPTDFEANSNRSAWPYGEVTGTVEWSNSLGSKVGYGTFGSSGNNYVFEPADEYKGDLARVYFYMITCYNDKNFTAGGKGYQMFTYSGNTAGFTSKALTLLLKWHRQDPVSKKETERSNAVSLKQHNTNPFVEDPNLVEFIWGKWKNEAYTCNASGTDVRPVQEENIRISVVGGRLNIRFDRYMDIRIYDITGREMRSVSADGQADISLPTGLYLVCVNNLVQKVMIPSFCLMN